MRDYGKVHTSFWTSPTISALSEDARTLALYLLTSPHSTITGVFRLPDGYACEDLGWSSERVVEGFRELFGKGFANRCETTKWVYIYKHFAWNKPENPNQRKAAKRVALMVPDECSWKLDFMRDWRDFLQITEDEFPNPSETLPKPFLNQEQEQKQEQDINIPLTPLPGGERPPPEKPKRERASRTTLKTFVAACSAAGEKPISDYQPLLDYVADTGLPMEFVQLAWEVFKGEFLPGGTNENRLQTQWRRHFLNYVKKGYYRLWYAKPSGDDGSVEYLLSTQGLQAQAALRRRQEAA